MPGKEVVGLCFKHSPHVTAKMPVGDRDPLPGQLHYATPG
jgi:hypothetical protein